MLGFSLAGEGEHLCLRIRKTGQNTAWVVEQIAAQMGISAGGIGHAGIKDRHAVTTQWLSIHCAGRRPDLSKLDIQGVEVLEQARHTHKLRPGTHQSNRFELVLEEVDDPVGHIESGLERIRQRGFSNYFGPQRFGVSGANLARGWSLLQKHKLKHHKKKSMYLSALRSYLFNCVLSARNHLHRVSGSGDEGKRAWEDTGPLWGRGRAAIPDSLRDFEVQELQAWAAVCNALEHSGLRQERRALYQLPQSLHWERDAEGSYRLVFELSPGAYATSLLGELAEVTDRSGAWSRSSFFTNAN